MECGAPGSGRSLASPDVRASTQGADFARGTRLPRLVITAQSPRLLPQQRNDASLMRDAYLRIDGVALALKPNPHARPPRNVATRAQARAPAPTRWITAGSLRPTPSLPTIAIGGSSKSRKSSKKSIRAWAIAAKCCLKSYHEEQQPQDASLKINGVAMVLRPTPRAARGHSLSQKLPWEASDPPSRQEAKELKRDVSFARRAATEALRLSGHSRGDEDCDQDGDGFHKRVGSTEENGPGPNNDPSVDSLEEA
ncbi:uncharacterized protein LOC133356920 [Lethenteron reissneri]|uniref:uncharacterized protein LOC133356920 n=1 Tax=Lethenteron reissneri TaxID=7753 RepID=UPI002AB6419F|nr:uncharacterized protein LOC133356920 [Lethenteron reissneri]